MTKFLDYSQYSSGYGKGGAKPGSFNIGTIDLSNARLYIEKEMQKNGKTLNDEIPSFDLNFLKLKSHMDKAFTQRKDMPVFDREDTKKLQAALTRGNLDINKPYAPETDPNELFPKNLKGEEAADFLKRGLNDGSRTDDIINVSVKKIKVDELIPIQEQIYLDKCVPRIAKNGIEERTEWIKNTLFITSSDNYIIDGHHRYATAMLINPKLIIECVVIELPIRKLLDLTVAFTDALGKQRNQ